MFSRLDRISACDRWTDRHSSRYAQASRGKNGSKLPAATHTAFCNGVARAIKTT